MRFSTWLVRFAPPAVLVLVSAVCDGWTWDEAVPVTPV
jgi:hypothetical protein